MRVRSLLVGGVEDITYYMWNWRCDGFGRVSWSDKVIGMVMVKMNSAYVLLHARSEGETVQFHEDLHFFNFNF